MMLFSCCVWLSPLPSAGSVLLARVAFPFLSIFGRRTGRGFAFSGSTQPLLSRRDGSFRGDGCAARRTRIPPMILLIS